MALEMRELRRCGAFATGLDDTGPSYSHPHWIKPLQVIPRILENPGIVSQRQRAFNWSNGQMRLVFSTAHVSHALEYQSLFRLPLAEFPAVQDMQSNFSELFARPVDLLWTPGVH